MNYKIEKYKQKLISSFILKKPNCNYLYKLSKYTNNHQRGGVVIDFIKNLDLNDSSRTQFVENIEQILHLIMENTKCKSIKATKNKYLVILIGAPGSGKSIARKIATKIVGNVELLKEMRTTEKYDNIFNSFMDISVDDYVYGAKINGEDNGADKLKKNYAEIYGNDALTEDEKLNEIKVTSGQQYFKIRNNLNSISSIMLYISAYLGLNIFFETIGHFNYIDNFLINDFCKYNKYIPIIIYPYISDNEIHKSRILDRAKIEGRLPDLDFVFKIKDSVDKTFNDLYDNSNKYLNDDLNMVILFKYDNSKQLSSENIKEYTFSEIAILKQKKFLLEKSNVEL